MREGSKTAKESQLFGKERPPAMLQDLLECFERVFGPEGTFKPMAPESDGAWNQFKAKIGVNYLHDNFRKRLLSELVQQVKIELVQSPNIYRVSPQKQQAISMTIK